MPHLQSPACFAASALLSTFSTSSDFYLGDAVAFHLFHGVAVALVFEGFAQVRNLLQAGEDESGQGFESGVARQQSARTAASRSRMLTEPSSTRPMSSSSAGSAGGDIEFVFDFADQLFEDVFDRDHAGSRAELVDHDRQMASALLEFGEQLGQDLGFGNDQHIVHDLADLHARNARSRPAGRDC